MEFKKEFIAIRHYIHAHPETSSEEFKTTQYLKEKLLSWGIRIVSTSLETGIIAEIGDAKKGPTIALRADIDALPILEQTDLAFSSINEGKMHACGHDLHQTSLLGAAYKLKQKEENLQGLVRLIFQAAEETHIGAQKVINAGHLQDVQAIIGYHNHPALSVGTIGLRAGGIMAAVDQFEVKVQGKGTHAAQPHTGTDVLLATSAIIQNLQSVISRNFSPLDAAVLSVTHMEAGNTWNVLPDTSFFEGTLRSFSAENREKLRKRFVDIVKQTAATFEVDVEINLIAGPPETFNDAKLTEWVKEASQTIATVIEVEPSTAGEDFANFQKVIPGVFAFIGSNGVKNAPAWHQSNFIVSDEALFIAIQYYVATTEILLEHLKNPN
ncbi:amidohydrolase [Lactococcus nasutitermitis]|uniref:Amidohydrolase n=1 Tax=Lactococcus nasutitermitis TaxID=1652957 RepID=A0ABV9JF27_9LACT|nr:amidohydrolase [Lactococcus nasutitermitis]